MSRVLVCYICLIIWFSEKFKKVIMIHTLLFSMMLFVCMGINVYAQEDGGPIGDGMEEGVPSFEAPPSVGGEDEMDGVEYNAAYVVGEAASPALQSVDLHETFSPDEGDEESASSEADAGPRTTESISLPEKSGVSSLMGVHHMPAAPASLALPASLIPLDSSHQKTHEESKKKKKQLKTK